MHKKRFWRTFPVNSSNIRAAKVTKGAMRWRAWTMSKCRTSNSYTTHCMHTTHTHRAHTTCVHTHSCANHKNRTLTVPPHAQAQSCEHKRLSTTATLPHTHENTHRAPHARAHRLTATTLHFQVVRLYHRHLLQPGQSPRLLQTEGRTGKKQKIRGDIWKSKLSPLTRSCCCLCCC